MQELYLTNLSKALKFFNPKEIRDAFFVTVLDLMNRKNEQVR